MWILFNKHNRAKYIHEHVVLRIQEQKTIDIKVLQLYTTIMSLYTFPSGQWHIYDIICSYAERIETLVYIPTVLILLSIQIFYTHVVESVGIRWNTRIRQKRSSSICIKQTIAFGYRRNFLNVLVVGLKQPCVCIAAEYAAHHYLFLSVYTKSVLLLN